MGMILIMSVLSKYGVVHQNLLSFIFLESIKDFREPRTIKMALLKRDSPASKLRYSYA